MIELKIIEEDGLEKPERNNAVRFLEQDRDYAVVVQSYLLVLDR